MELQNHQHSGFSAYRTDLETMQSPFPLPEIHDPSRIWQALDDGTLDLGDEWLNGSMDMSVTEHSFLGDAADAPWHVSPVPEFFVGDTHEAELILQSSTGADSPQAGAAGTTEDRGKAARHRRLTSDQTAVLDAWLSEHKSYPYPAENDKVRLAAATGLSRKQVEHWFSRTRQRKIPKPE